MDSLFAFAEMRCWKLVLAEFESIQCALELLVRVQAGKHRADLVIANFLSAFYVLVAGLQPEAAEIAQFYDIAFCQLTGDNGKKGLNSGDEGS